MTVTQERVAQAMIISIDRPERRNAIDRTTAQGLIDAVAEAQRAAASDDPINAVILTGKGAFCSGGDHGAIKDSLAENRATPASYTNVHTLVRSMMTLPVPTIAAVDGAAIGLGMDLALTCDLRFIGPEGWLRQGWATFGAIPAAGGSRVINRFAPDLMWRLVVEQERLDGPTCESMGLATAVRSGSAREAALAFSERLTNIPLTAVHAYTELFRAPAIDGLDAHLVRCGRLQADLFNGRAFQSRLGSTRATTS